VLKTLPENHFHSVVTDPPYELGFMGKKWDSSGVAFDPETWKAVLRVMRPGAYLLAFGGSRTYHRLACAIEDAGFTLRDSLMWLYGQGFPKSFDISKGIDKQLGVEREILSKEIYRTQSSSGGIMNAVDKPRYSIETQPATDDAKKWQGWGTQLKPAFEPIILAQKPIAERNIPLNILKHGAGAMNIEASKIETLTPREKIDPTAQTGASTFAGGTGIGGGSKYLGKSSYEGRWPTNVILDEVTASLLDEQSGNLSGPGGPGKQSEYSSGKMFSGIGTKQGKVYPKEEGGASRFFYVAKPRAGERGEYNDHATVKPLELMSYLVKLVTPTGGVVLDPFAGSGTTLMACKRLDFDFVGIELEPQHIQIINRRLGDMPDSLFKVAC
jgi:DNA modification methylase